MPQASDEDRAWIEQQFGDGVSDEGPMKFLINQGFKLTRGWEWVPRSGVSSWKDMNEFERRCMAFLIEEWDFGGLTAPSDDALLAKRA